MAVKRMDHVGIIVKDIEAAKTFFLELGLELRGEAEVEGEWVGRVIGLGDVKSKIAMLGAPNGETSVELAQFIRPATEEEPAALPSNALGIRHVTFAVDDLDSVLQRLKTHGAELVGEIERYEDIFRLCYIRGPEGIIVELAEELRP